MKKSILQGENEGCWFCGKQYGLHTHHIFFGSANRKKSDKYGFTVKLCAEHHNMGNKCVHNNAEMDLKLKQACQREFEKTHSREEFMDIIHKNYLD